LESSTYRAATVVVPDVATHAMLAEAFNAWVEQERPSAILHIHYYHDTQAHVRGYQIIYSESDGSQRRNAARKTTSREPLAPPPAFTL